MTERTHVDSTKLSEAPYTHYTQKRNGTLVPLARDIEAEAFVDTFIQNTRAKLAGLSNDTTGLDIDRLNAHLEDIGASKKPQLFLQGPEFKQALEIIESSSNEPHGIYNESLGVSLVKRTLALEAINGTELTESFAVHEAAHSTHIPTPFRLLHTKPGLFKPRTVTTIPGMRVYGMTQKDSVSRQYGTLFEEGYAELERGIFIQANDLTAQFTDGAANYEKAKRTALPLHYMYKDPAEKPDEQPTLTFAPGVFAASIFEILMKSDETLLPALRRSRHDTDGLREVAETIDSISPGLHTALQQADESAMINIFLELRK